MQCYGFLYLKEIKTKAAIVCQYPLNEIDYSASVYVERLIYHIAHIDNIELYIVTIGNENNQFRKGDLNFHVIRRALPTWLYLFWGPIEIWLFRRKIIKINPDIVHALYASFPYATAAALVRNKYPTVLSVAGIPERQIKYETGVTRFIDKLTHNPNAGFVISKIPNIIVETLSIKSLVSNMTNSKIYVVPVGVEFGKVQKVEPQPDEKPDILFLGNLTKIKGIDLLIEAIPIVMKIFPDVQVYIAGAGPQEKQLKRLVEKLSLENWVRFLGFIPESMKYQYFKACKIVVVPSRWDCQPFSLVDAAAAGKPVIASNASNPEVVENGKTGFLFESENVEELANKIIKLLTDETLREEMGKAARERAREYDWSKIAERTVAVYKEVLANYQSGKLKAGR